MRVAKKGRRGPVRGSHGWDGLAGWLAPGALPQMCPNAIPELLAASSQMANVWSNEASTPKTNLQANDQSPPVPLSSIICHASLRTPNATVVIMTAIMYSFSKCLWFKATNRTGWDFEPATSWSAVKCSTTELYVRLGLYVVHLTSIIPYTHHTHPGWLTGMVGLMYQALAEILMVSIKQYTVSCQCPQKIGFHEALFKTALTKPWYANRRLKPHVSRWTETYSRVLQKGEVALKKTAIGPLK